MTRTRCALPFMATCLHFFSKYSPFRSARKLTFQSGSDKDFNCGAPCRPIAFWWRNAPPIDRPAAAERSGSFLGDEWKDAAEDDPEFRGGLRHAGIGHDTKNSTVDARDGLGGGRTVPGD